MTYVVNNLFLFFPKILKCNGFTLQLTYKQPYVGEVNDVEIRGIWGIWKINDEQKKFLTNLKMDDNYILNNLDGSLFF